MKPLPLSALAAILIVACMNLACRHHEARELTLADLPIGKLVLPAFLENYGGGDVKVIRYDGDTGEVLDFKFGDSVKCILIDTCQHGIARGRAAYTERITGVSLVNFDIMHDHGSTYHLSFLDDTLFQVSVSTHPDFNDTIARDFGALRDHVLKTYFTKPRIDTTYYNPVDEVCRNKQYVSQHTEILYRENDVTMKYEVSQRVYDFGEPTCTVSSSIGTTWYDASDYKIMSRLWDRDTTLVE